MNKLYTLFGILAIICAGLAGAYSYDKAVVKRPELNEVKKGIVPRVEFEMAMQQVNEQTLQNRIDFYQRVVWDMENKYNTQDCMKMPTTVREKYRRAQQQLQKAISDLQRKMRGK